MNILFPAAIGILLTLLTPFSIQFLRTGTASIVATIEDISLVKTSLLSLLSLDLINLIPNTKIRESINSGILPKVPTLLISKILLKVSGMCAPIELATRCIFVCFDKEVGV